ncbi:DNA-binding HxlR family transcriptional regulator [Catenulispora sp. EB89]|uniref:winged helix-turn-helix transcriptional regulator n=1 Tax=Catenulispora sp. EB89 TaxID=3156257 RepID=UPI0035155FD6
MPRTDYSDFACSVARSLEVMGQWWTPLILRDLYLGVNTFDELVADLGISRSLLTARLADLGANGLIRREPYGEREDRYRYLLEPPGRELIPLLATLAAWGDRWQTPQGGPPLLFEHAGHECVPTVACSTCSEALTAETLVPVPGPGARAVRGTAVVASRPLPS